MIRVFSKDVGAKLLWHINDPQGVPFDMTGFQAKLFSDTIPAAVAGLDLDLGDNPDEVQYITAAPDTIPVGRHTCQVKIYNNAGRELRCIENRIIGLESRLTP